jgi:hypothetical protein
MKAVLIFLSSALCSCAIEKPPYEVLAKDGSFELRKYPAIKIISAPMANMDKRDDSFRKLFRYISGENAAQQKISMTAPVFMSEGSGKKANQNPGVMSFMIPAKVVERGVPAPGEKVLEIKEIGQGTFAVFSFKGWNNAEQRQAASLALQDVIKQRKLKAISEPFFAFYNPPWTPEFLRRNEVWQRVE